MGARRTEVAALIDELQSLRADMTTGLSMAAGAAAAGRHDIAAGLVDDCQRTLAEGVARAAGSAPQPAPG